MTESRTGKLLYRLTILNVGLLILLYIGETLIAERHWITTLVTYAPQQLFGVPTALLVLCSLASRRWRLLAANLVALAFFATAMLGLHVPIHAHTRSTAPKVRLMTYNIHHGLGGLKTIAEDVKAVEPDVVCFQEANREGKSADPVLELRKELPGWHIVSHGQLAIFSKWPIAESHVYQPPVEHWRVFLRAGVQVHGRRLNVICLHLNTAAEPESMSAHHGSLSSYLHRSTRARSVQVSELLKYTSDIRGPLVVMGDFNTPPRGRIYRRLAANFSDSFRQAGWGLGYSFKSDLPVLRIDYIWAGRDMSPVACDTRALKGSDHRPVVADLQFAR